MAERKPFLLRIDSDLYAALARWAGDERRSLNGQIEFLLRQTLVEARTQPKSASPPPTGARTQGRLPASMGGERRLPKSVARAPRLPKTLIGTQRLPKPVSPPPSIPRPPAREPLDERPPARVPDSSWDAMED